MISVLSWGSGANPWGPEKDDQFSKPNHYDGMLEVVGVTGVVHLGQIQSGLRSAMRIAQVNDQSIKQYLYQKRNKSIHIQLTFIHTIFRNRQGGHIKIHSHSEVPVQVDGEPWVQPPGEVVVFNSALKVSLCFYYFSIHFHLK